MKYFISQPMNGLSTEEILQRREEILKFIRILDADAEVDDSLIEEIPKVKNEPLWCLGESLKLLSDADAAFFARGWEDCRGCQIEHESAEGYNIIIIEEV